MDDGDSFGFGSSGFNDSGSSSSVVVVAPQEDIYSLEATVIVVVDSSSSIDSSSSSSSSSSNGCGWLEWGIDQPLSKYPPFTEDDATPLHRPPSSNILTNIPKPGTTNQPSKSLFMGRRLIHHLHRHRHRHSHNHSHSHVLSKYSTVKLSSITIALFLSFLPKSDDHHPLNGIPISPYHGHFILIPRVDGVMNPISNGRHYLNHPMVHIISNNMSCHLMNISTLKNLLLTINFHYNILYSYYGDNETIIEKKKKFLSSFLFTKINNNFWKILTFPSKSTKKSSFATIDS
ncbi:hypothetical protein U3516DRAFT_733018 [Neocallimastix sp. 'constans']